MTLALHLSDRPREADALRGLGEVDRLVGDCGQARAYHTQVLARQLGYRRAEADALRGLAQIERLVGECGQAREYHTQALALGRQLGDRRVEADALRGDSARLSGSSAITTRPVNTTARPWSWPANLVTDVPKPTR